MTALTIARALKVGPDCLPHIAPESERPVWISVVPREQLLQAGQAACRTDLPLRGVPFAVKDNIDVEGMATTAGCPSFARQADRTAPVVRRLLDAGAVLVGKTNLDQFATGLVGTRTPYGACSSVFDKRYISGGSSSGSAVAVTAGQVGFALGTDTAGSGRVPAAFNNLVGFKPTRGLLSTTGVVPACRSLDCISIFAGNVADASLVFDVTRSFDAADPFSREAPPLALFPQPIRIGAPRVQELDFLGDAEAELFRAAIARIRSAGMVIEEVEVAGFLEAGRLLYEGAWVAERYAAVGEFLETGPVDADPIVRDIILSARRLTAVDAFRATYRLAALRRETDHVWNRIDALLLPTTPTIFTHEEIAEKPIERNTILGTYTNFVNLLDLAAIALPAGFRTNGLPFGISLIGPAFSDATLLGAAARYEEMFDRRPRIRIAVVGAHLSGQPLNPQLTEREGRLAGTARTGPHYRLFALAGTKPEKPGLIFDPSFSGRGIEVEIWEIPEEHVGSFLKLVAAPLGLGTLRLEDGSTVHGFICEGSGVEGAREITEFGGWRAYRASQV